MTDGSKNKRKNGIFNQLKRLGDLRDGFLIGGGVLYILGYIVWSLNALRNNMGLLPALDSQYFLAGIVPAIILWLLIVGIRSVKRFIEKLPEWFSTNKKEWKVTLHRVFICFFITSFMVFLASLTDWYGKTFPFTWRYVIPISLTITMITSYFVAAKWFTSRFVRFVGIINFTYYLVLFCYVGLSFYVSVVYPKLPQELGGVHPRRGYLDILRAQVSNETLRDLVSDETFKSNKQVVRSIEVEVLFSGSNFILLRPNSVGEEKPKVKVYEIKNSAIQVIYWFDKTAMKKPIL